jgi:hypothetical protein
MSLDPQRVAEARDWLLRSLADLESAAILIDSTPAHPDTRALERLPLASHP